MSTEFERMMLKDATKEARRYGADVKAAYVHGTAMGCGASKNWEFFYKGYYYHIGSAENAYDARCKGWEAWTEAQKAKFKVSWPTKVGRKGQKIVSLVAVVKSLDASQARMREVAQ